jgi:hypothetical protein
MAAEPNSYFLIFCSQVTNKADGRRGASWSILKLRIASDSSNLQFLKFLFHRIKRSEGTTKIHESEYL